MSGSLDKGHLVVFVPGFAPFWPHEPGLGVALQNAIQDSGSFDFRWYEWRDKVSGFRPSGSFGHADQALDLAARVLVQGIATIPAAAPGFLPILVPMLRDYLKEKFAAQRTKAIAKGETLGRDLMAYCERQSRCPSMVSIVGFSLGCHLVSRALDTGLASVTNGPVRVASIVYLGAAVPNDMFPTLSGVRLRNFYSRRDAVLRFLYPQVSEGRTAAGYTGFVNPPEGIANLQYPVGHRKYAASAELVVELLRSQRP